MKSDAELLRARRRYKVLMREYNALSADGVHDDELQASLDELLAQYPSLADLGKPPLAPVAQLPPDVHATSGDGSRQQQSDASSHAAMPEVRGTKRAPGARRGSASPVTEVTMAHLQHTLSQLQSTNQFAFALFFFNVYNESQRRTIFPALSYFLLAAATICLALVHRFIIPPCSIPGSHCLPITLCTTLHLATLLYLRRARKVTLSYQMLVVYFVYDYGPSIGLSVALYAITMVVLNLCGAPLVVFVC